jgi:FkbM family methyltransferase
MLRSARYVLAGLYFTYVKKVFVQDGIKIHVPMELTDYKFRGRFVLGTYEKEEATYLGQYLEPEDAILELGACLGYVSCLANAYLGDTARHVVLEANPQLIPFIQRNKLENNAGFHIENRIISRQKGNTFYIHQLIVGGSQKRKTPHKIEVEGVSISSLEKKYGLRFNTLIMDIEGGELEFLRNHQPDLGRFEKIFMELHPFAGILTGEEALECEQILVSLGFELTLRDGNFLVWQKDIKKE